MTGRDPQQLADLIARFGDDVWLGIAGQSDRGDRHSQRAERRRAAAERKDTTVTGPSKSTSPQTAKAVKDMVGILRTMFTGTVAIDPVDKDAPAGTQRRRVAAYNALQDLAKPGRDRYCGFAGSGGSPCVLRVNHHDSRFDDTTVHMTAEQRERAFRYLTHSNPDPAQRA
jgi:hypothetical protein